jgi:hypothetical protein
MPFIENDLYLASGVDQLINAYPDPVYKYDSSSFYNWEQDNEPLYDLEERDDLLHEMAGYPTSAMSGMMLTVSCCGIDNKKIFGNIQDLVGALPNTIRFPIIVEVAASGQLGELRLENIQFEGPTAGLEFINRGFAKVLCGSGTPISTIQAVNSSSITQFESTDLSSAMTDSSSLGVSATVWNSFNNANEYWNNFSRSFVSTPEWGQNSLTSFKTVTMSTRFKDAGGTDFLESTANRFSVEDYADNSVATDIEIILPDNSVLQRDDLSTGSTTRAVGSVYANALSNLVINNCTGKIFLRGFCVDGMSQAVVTATGTQRTEIGMAIRNSSVMLENCAVTRCSEAGAEILNSSVVLNRGFIAYRNYKLETGSSHLDTKNIFKTPGLKAVNSDVMLSSTAVEDKGLPIDSPFCFSRNQVGIELCNSRLHNPKEFVYAKSVDGTSVANSFGVNSLVLQTFFNIEEGIKAVDSIIDFDQRLSTFQNKVGVDLYNSTFKIGETAVEYNQESGVVATNSTVVYNKNALRWSLGGPFDPQTGFHSNGQHLNLVNSTFDPPYIEGGMLTPSTRLQFKNHFKQVERSTVGTSEGQDTVPAVSISRGSSMEGVCVKAQCYDVTSNTADVVKSDTFRKGLIFSVTEGSNLTLHSHRVEHTMLLGPYDPTKQQNTAGIYAGKNSSVYIAGPTHIAQFGIDALAEDNSVIEFGPHKKHGTIDVSGWGLTNTNNHTKVELHATRACLVANKNSEIIMKDMGGFSPRWASKYTSDLDLAPSSTASTGFANTQKIAPYIASGAMLFYPNPYAAYGTTVGTELNLVDQAHPSYFMGIDTATTKTLGFTGVVTDLSYGGFCVRAVQDSAVTAQNIEFLCDYQNTSGAYYDASATACELLRMWNIADSSKLHASYVSVNGYHPREVSGSYYGPSSVWNDGNTPLSGAPSSTPDTSSLSVLDSFGHGTPTGGEAGYYSENSFRNVGPFRLYVSPSPKAKFLGFPENSGGVRYTPPVNPLPFVSMGYNFDAAATLKTGVPYQALAQGYNCSGDCSASPVGTVSAIYQDLGFSSYVESLPLINREENVASSFFYTSAMLADTSKNIWLDESAMNTFANAKNGTLNTSGRRAIFSFFSPKTVYPGEATWIHDAGVGFGSANLFDTDRNI